MTITDVVIGPRTRLAQALPDTPGHRAILIARNDVDSRSLAQTGKTVTSLEILRTSDSTLAGPVRILVCALGPVQASGPVDIDGHTKATRRDLGLIESIVHRDMNALTDVVYVSSVLALAPRPRPDREYYTAWKQTLEDGLISLCADHSGATLSVFYPGRLVDETASPAHRMVHTAYSSLASAISAVPSGSAYREVVGRDAKLWLLKRGVVPRRGIRPTTLSPMTGLIQAAINAPAV